MSGPEVKIKRGELEDEENEIETWEKPRKRSKTVRDIKVGTPTEIERFLYYRTRSAHF